MARTGGVRRRGARRMRRLIRRKLRVSKRNLRSNDVASLSESILFTALPPVGPSTGTFQSGVKNTTFTTYRNTDLSLSTFYRAGLVAQGYQYFKIKYLELSIVPDFDTFIVGGPGAQGKPMFYYMIDRGNAIPFNVSNQAIKAMGAKPIALDEKSIKIRWRPGVVLANEIVSAAGTVSAQQYMTSPWLPCCANSDGPGPYQLSQVCHQGIKFFAENFGGSVSYTATLTAHFAFKKPSVPAAAPGQTAPE